MRSVNETNRDTELQKNANNAFENILDDIGGSFSKFHLINYALLSIPIAISGLIALTYVFTTLSLDYRQVSKYGI